METKESFEKVMQGFRSAMPLGSSKNQHRNGRSLRKYCQDEGFRVLTANDNPSKKNANILHIRNKIVIL